ncbi:MAG: retropepsin-like aspartic protease [Bacteroidota bacterium]
MRPLLYLCVLVLLARPGIAQQASPLGSSSAAVTAADLPSDTTFTEVTLVRDGAYALVPVRIGALDSLLFILDTAASASVLSPDTRDALGFTEDDGGIAQVLGASGPTEYQLLELDALTVGTRTVRTLRVAVIDLERFRQSEIPYAGILGNDVLRQFDVEYNWPESRLGLYEKGTLPEVRLNDFTPVPFAGGGFGGFVSFDAALADASARVIVDTGAGTSVFNAAAAALEGAIPGTEGVQRQDEATRGLGDEETETYRYTFSDFGVGDVMFEPREVRIADLPVFRVLGLSDQPAVILGNDVLGQRPLFLLYSTGTAYFGPLDP